MNIKKFNVNITVQVYKDLVVFGESEQEAEDKAKEIMGNEWMEGEMEHNTMSIGHVHEVRKQTCELQIKYRDGKNKTVTIIDYPDELGIKNFTEIAKRFNPGVDIVKINSKIK